jgi:translation initiation factor 1 (eIF-1/SUI1)
MYAQFNRFEIKMTLEQAKSVSHQGRCDEDVTELLKDKKFRRQFNKIDSESIAAELKELLGLRAAISLKNWHIKTQGD